MYALRHKQLLFLCDLASWLCYLLACRFSYEGKFTSCIDLGSALTYCVVLCRVILRQCSPSVLMSVYPSVVFGICQYILVFSLISSNFISVLSIVDCRYLESGSSLSLCPVKKICHIFITFEVYILKMQYGMHLSLDVRLLQVIV